MPKFTAKWALLVLLLLLPFLFITLKSAGKWVGISVIDRSLKMEREEIREGLKNATNERELLLLLKEANRNPSPQYMLIGPSGRPIYQQTGFGSVRIETLPFTLHGSSYELKQIVPEEWRARELSKSKDLLMLAGVLFLIPSFLLGGLGIYLWRANRRLRYGQREASYERGLIADQIGVGVCILDRALQVKEVNRTAAELLGCIRTDILGDFFSVPKGNLELQERLQSLCIRCQDRSSSVHDRANPIDLLALPSYGGRMVVILQDCSSHYRLIKMGKDFIGNASHELRTPITIIKGFVETLIDMPQVTEAMLEDILHKVLRNCERMEKLIKSLLLLADLDAWSKERIQSCDLVSLVDQSIQTLQSVHPEAKIEVQCDKEEVLVRADGELLEVVINNLLQNAIKYSVGTPEITVKLEEIINETQLSVFDRGCGIPKKDLPYIFERFYTVDKARSRKLGGAGLGLSIVKTILEKHEGKIKAVSEEGKGSAFIASLPR